MALEVKVNLQRLLDDSGWPSIGAMVRDMNREGVRVNYAAACKWFSRDSIPAKRLLEIMVVARVRNRKALNLWHYVDARRRWKRGPKNGQNKQEQPGVAA